MKRNSFERYNARALNGSSCLYLWHDDTLEGVKGDIDASNKRAMEQGYKAERWLITHIEVYVWVDDAGMFSKREELEQAVEIYPEEVER